MKKSDISVPLIPDLYQITSKDFSRACNILGQAFQEDPIWKQILKEDPEKFSLAFAVPLKCCLKYGKVYSSSPNLEGIAAWISSINVELNIFQLIRSGAIFSAMKLGSKISKRIQEVFDLINKDRKIQMKDSCIYLYILGVAPDHQGLGIGSRLINSMLNQLSPEIPVYLETGTEKNVRFYEKLGFKILKKVLIPSLKLPMWEMLLTRK
jgi:ribosomal protein S18 acetylase RimI-like enzyme